MAAAIVGGAAALLVVVGTISLFYTGSFPPAYRDSRIVLQPWAQQPTDVKIFYALKESNRTQPVIVARADPQAEPWPAYADGPQDGGLNSLILLAVFGLIYFAFGASVLWGSREPSAYWLGMLCVALAPAFLAHYAALSAPLMLVARFLQVGLEYFAYYAVFRLALAITLDALDPQSPIRRSSKLIHAVVAASIAFAIAANWVRLACLVAQPDTQAGWIGRITSVGAEQFITAVGVLFGPVSLALLGLGWIRGSNAWQRRRVGIVLLTMFIALSGRLIYVAQFMVSPNANGLIELSTIMLPVGFIIAIPAYRVVNVGFVTRGFVRSAVGILTLVGLTFVEIKGHAFMTRVSTATHSAWDLVLPGLLEAVGLFAIVLGMNQIERWLEPLIERRLYAKRFQGLKNIHDYMENLSRPETTIAAVYGCTDVVRDAIGASAVALYEWRQGHYARVAGDTALPAQLDAASDPALTRLNDARGAIALSKSGWAFPMTVKQRFSGTLVCAPRKDREFEGDYTREELSIVQELATNVAQEIVLMRYGMDGSAAQTPVLGEVGAT